MHLQRTVSRDSEVPVRFCFQRWCVSIQGDCDQRARNKIAVDCARLMDRLHSWREIVLLGLRKQTQTSREGPGHKGWTQASHWYRYSPCRVGKRRAATATSINRGLRSITLLQTALPPRQIGPEGRRRKDNAVRSLRRIPDLHPDTLTEARKSIDDPQDLRHAMCLTPSSSRRHQAVSRKTQALPPLLPKEDPQCTYSKTFD